MENEVVNETAQSVERVDFGISDWVQDTDGKWALSEAAKARSLELYYSGRLAYSKEDTSKPIGRYNSVGEVIPFKTWVDQ